MIQAARIQVMNGACGYYMPHKGRACLGSPTTPGGRCIMHLAEKVEPAPAKLSGQAGVISALLRATDRALYAEIVREGCLSLEDQIGLCRLRIAELESRFTEGSITREKYADELRGYWKSLNSLTSTQAKLAELDVLRDSPRLPMLPGVPDAFDPVLAGADSSPAEAPTPAAEVEGPSDA